MDSILRLFRHFVFVFFFVAVFASAGALIQPALFGPIGAGAGLLFAITLLGLSERWLIDMISATSVRSGPLVKELESAARRIAIRDGRRPADILKNLPALYVFQDAFPVVLVTRSFGSRGSIIFSEGLVSSIRSQPLGEAIELALDRLSAPGLARATAASALVELLLKLTPGGWAEWLACRSLGIPISRRTRALPWKGAVQSLLLIPFVWLFAYLSSDLPWTVTGAGGAGKMSGGALLRPYIESRMIPGLSHETAPLSIWGLCLQMPLPET